MNRSLAAILCCATLPSGPASADTLRGREDALFACEAALAQQGIAPVDLAAVSIRPRGGGYTVSGKVALNSGPDARFTCSTEAGTVTDLRIGT